MGTLAIDSESPFTEVDRTMARSDLTPSVVIYILSVSVSVFWG